MSLARAFTLETLQQIFQKQSKFRISSRGQILYINCLMHHFSSLPEDEALLKGFELFEQDIKNYEKWKADFEELHKAGLVHISVMRMINFDDVWSEFIDRSIFDQKPQLTAYARFEIEEYEDKLYNSHQLYELCGMKYKLKNDQTNALLKIFIAEQKTTKKKYDSESDCIKHFIYWVQTNKDKTPQKSSTSSQGKILGKE